MYRLSYAAACLIRCYQGTAGSRVFKWKALIKIRRIGKREKEEGSTGKTGKHRRENSKAVKQLRNIGFLKGYPGNGIRIIILRLDHSHQNSVFVVP